MTTITVSTAELKRHLAIVKAATAPRGSLPILAGVRLEAEADGLTMTATDLELTATATISASGTTDGDTGLSVAVVNAKALADALPAGKGSTTLTWSTELDQAPHLTVDNGPGHPTATIPTLPLEEWPRLEPEAPTMHAVTTSAIDDVCQAVSTDRTRPILCQVLFDKGKAVGTDSYRLVIAETGVPAELEGMVDGRVLKLALKAAKLDKATAMAVGIGDRTATVCAGAFTFHHRLQEGEFPPYERLVPTTLPHRIDLADALPAVKAADKVLRGAKSNGPVRIVATDDSVNVRAVVDNAEVMRQSFPIGRTDVELTVAYNLTYLATALAMSTDGLLEVTDALKPAVLRTANGVHLLMPVRVS